MAGKVTTAVSCLLTLFGAFAADLANTNSEAAVGAATDGSCGAAGEACLRDDRSQGTIGKALGDNDDPESRSLLQAGVVAEKKKKAKGQCDLGHGSARQVCCASTQYQSDSTQCRDAGCIWRDAGHLAANGYCSDQGNIYFEGTQGTNDFYSAHGYKRPEYVKATRDGVECDIYSGTTDCFQSTSSRMTLESGTAVGIHHLEILFDCDGLNELKVNDREESRPITVTVNGQPVGTNGQAKPWLTYVWQRPSPSPKYALLSVAITVDASNQNSRTELQMYAEGYPAKFDECQQTKECMTILTASSDGMVLRSSNDMQISCLEGTLTSSICQTWKACTDKEGTTRQLLSLIRASQPASVTWKIGADLAGSCDSVCQQVGGTCSDAALTNLGLSAGNQQPDALKQAYEGAGAGLTCNNWNKNCAGGNCVNWGLPFIHSSHFNDGLCWGGDAVAPCSQTPVDGHHRRLCPCTGIQAQASLTQSQAHEKMVSSHDQSSTAGDCVTPSVADPESWNCECHDALLAACQTECGADEGSIGCANCKQREMCCYPATGKPIKICQAWKDSVNCAQYGCASSSSLSEQHANRSGQNEEAEMGGSSMDSSILRKSNEC